MLCQTMRSVAPKPDATPPRKGPKRATTDGEAASPRQSRLDSLSTPRSPRAPSRRGGPAKKTPVGFGSSSASVYLKAKLPANHAV